ncbi:CBS domain-containing protein [Primorskyibacter sp. 2E107]|uniref:CBS domain-containing protein n=1 Tax=Primorskyibacter sp. 2E107 TaxID=3403458 RepID=UPI003AF98F62
MTSPVVKIQHDATVNQALALMSRHNVGFLPVVRDGWIDGVVTDRDILLRGTINGAVEFFCPIDSLTTRHVQQAGPLQPLEEITALMIEHDLRRIPITDSLGYLVGVISLTDIAQRAAPEHALSVLRTIAEQPARRKTAR